MESKSSPHGTASKGESSTPRCNRPSTIPIGPTLQTAQRAAGLNTQSSYSPQNKSRAKPSAQGARRPSTIAIEPKLRAAERPNARGAALELRREVERLRSKAFKPFRFTDLPGEIRNRIFDILFRGEIVRVSCHRKVIVGGKSYECERRQPAITRVCRQLREEALPLFYQESVFELRCLCGSPIMPKWLNAVRGSHVHLRGMDVWIASWGIGWLSGSRGAVGFRLRCAQRTGDIRVWTTKPLTQKSHKCVHDHLQKLIDANESRSGAIVTIAIALMHDPSLYRQVKLNWLDGPPERRNCRLY